MPKGSTSLTNGKEITLKVKLEKQKQKNKLKHSNFNYIEIIYFWTIPLLIR